MDKLRDRIVLIRHQFERREIPIELLKQLYQAYNPLEDIDTFLKEAEEIFPKLNCGLASVYLKNIFGGQIVKGRYEDEPHTFLMLDNKVIDITADQFGGPKVYIGFLKDPWFIV